MKVFYNSWSSTDKIPFGAIQANTTVIWSLRVDEKVDQATLWLTKNSETPVAYPMNAEEGDNRYQTKVKVGTAGLYTYYFVLKKGQQNYYVQKGMFGQGQLTQDRNHLVSFQLTCYARAVPKVNWYQHGIVYQIFPDRFANGNPHGEITGRKKDSFIYATHEDTPYYIKNQQGQIVRWDFYGGNLAGIKAKIPYLRKLGVTIIYLNPIFLSNSNHRYDTVDYMKIDPMLGTEKNLRELITTLHQNGMHLILDGVFNHAGRDSIYFQGALEGKDNPYYSWFNFIVYPNRYQSWWGVSALPEFNKGNPAVQQFIYGSKGVLAKWTKMQVDGWRLDVADELPMPFLRKIRERLMHDNCQVMIGEVWEDASNKFVNNQFRPYTSGDNLTGVMNYPTRNFVFALLTAKDLNSALQAMNNFAQLVENYPWTFLQNCLNNIGTHDTARIKTLLHDDEHLVLLAFAIMFMLPGVPCIYYGDEAGQIGGKDPDNRRFFPWKHESAYLEQKVRAWCHYRRQHSSLVDGKIGFVAISKNVNGIVRFSDQRSIIFIFNKDKNDYKIKGQALQLFGLSSGLQKSIKTFLDSRLLPAEGYLLKEIEN